MQVESWRPYGLMLQEFLTGDAGAAAVVHSDEGARLMPGRLLFRRPAEFPPVEKRALAACRGRVLDAGAGAGCHSLALQERGLAVTALDISPEAVEVMRRRGLRDVRLGDVASILAEPFDTVLMLMHGIGLVETLAGLHTFLAQAGRLVAPGGQILLDSLDVRQWEETGGRYEGEVVYWFEYRGLRGAPFTWLYVDFGTLGAIASETGWRCRRLYQEPDGEEYGRYLARLWRKRRWS